MEPQVAGNQAVPIDVQSLQERCLGDAAFVREVLGIFKRQGVTFVANLRRNLSDGDAVGLAKSAHALKGSAANISACALSALSGELEASAAAISPAEGQVRMAAIAAEFERVIAFIDAMTADSE